MHQELILVHKASRDDTLISLCLNLNKFDHPIRVHDASAGKVRLSRLAIVSLEIISIVVLFLIGAVIFVNNIPTTLDCSGVKYHVSKFAAVYTHSKYIVL